MNKQTIKHRLIIEYNNESSFIIEIDLRYRLNLCDRIYVWDFLTEDMEIPEWLKEGGCAVITDCMITDKLIICDLIYEYKIQERF